MYKLTITLLILAGQAFASSQEFFGRTQNVLEEFQGSPLVSANWEGRFRPYLYEDGKFNSLMSPEQSKLHSNIDFYGPKPLNDTQFLLYAEHLGQPNGDLWIFDASAKKLQIIPQMATPEPSWYDRSCVSRGNDLIAFPTRGGQTFSKLDTGALKLRNISLQEKVPNFSSCLWLDQNNVLGIVQKPSRSAELMHCKIGADKVNCSPTRALSDFVEASQFFIDKSGRPGIIGIEREETFRKAYVLSKDYSKVIALKPPLKLLGDVLDVQQGHFRVGLHGRYVTDLTRVPSPNDVISKFKKIGNNWYAIATNPQQPRTLAVLENDAWKLLPFATLPPTAEIKAPVEIITRSPTGKNYQSFLYGPASSKNVVVWLHGGPHESVSPRFHPYIHSLNEKGYSVLAVNYPGSTGRGFSYENAMDKTFHIDCMQSVMDYLKSKQTEQIVVWSVSYGDRLQKEMLESDFPITAIVDQVGILPNGQLKKLAQEKNVPYFSIRGKFDLLSPADNPDFLYEGAHDITHYQDFDRLMDRLNLPSEQVLSRTNYSLTSP